MNNTNNCEKIKKRLGQFIYSRSFRLLTYFVLYLIIFLFNFQLVRDPDFGWHLKYGEQVVNHGKFLTTDIFSHTFAGQGEIQTEWLTEAIYFIIFSRWSYFGLALFSAIVNSLIFFLPVLFICGTIEVKFFMTLWAILGSEQVLRIGARPQNISLLFFSLVFLILFTFNQKKEKKWLILLPVIFLIWANSHPGFFVGLFILLIYLLIEIFTWFYSIVSLRFRRIHFCFNNRFYSVALLFVMFVLSALLTTFRPQQQKMELLSLDQVKALLLPAGIAVKASVGGKARVAISEFLPPVLADIGGTLFFLGIIFVIALFIDKPLTSFDFKNLIMLFVVIYFSTLTRRNTPFFFLVFLPIAVTYTDFIIRNYKIKPTYINYLKKIATLKYLVLFIILLIVFQKIYIRAGEIKAKGYSNDTYCQSMNYPCEAINFIKREKLKGNMFNHYNWGAYLVWRLPEYPVFIHGRFPTNQVFAEYDSVMGLKDGWQEILKKYNVGWILLPRDQLYEDILNIEGKWTPVYTDDKAVVLVKKQ